MRTSVRGMLPWGAGGIRHFSSVSTFEVLARKESTRVHAGRLYSVVIDLSVCLFCRCACVCLYLPRLTTPHHVGSRFVPLRLVWHLVALQHTIRSRSPAKLASTDGEGMYCGRMSVCLSVLFKAEPVTVTATGILGHGKEGDIEEAFLGCAPVSSSVSVCRSVS